MTYKINNTSDLPSPKAYLEELADFWEIQATRYRGQFVSRVEIAHLLNPQLDELKHEGLESDDDKVFSRLDATFSELESRVNSTGRKYPFSFGSTSIKLGNNDTAMGTIYLYLLLCTRLNMKDRKIQNGIDGTLLFEKLCAIVAKNYFGEKSQSIVFGTAVSGNFQNKVNDLIRQIGEGGQFSNPNTNPPTQNDAGIDVVAWCDFADKQKGKLIAFGQCKTGTSWRDTIHTLKPDTFCRNWFLNPPIFSPLPIVFITDTLNKDKNFVSDQDGYLFFNRFRILEYVNDDLDSIIFEQIEQWVAGALESLEDDT